MQCSRDSLSGASEAATSFEQRLRSETMQIHAWQVQTNMKLETNKSELERAEESKGAALKEAAHMTAEMRKAQEAHARSEDARRQLEAAFQAEQAKAAVSMEGLSQCDYQLDQQQAAVDHMELWRNKAEDRVESLMARAANWKEAQTADAERKKREWKRVQEELAKMQQLLHQTEQRRTTASAAAAKAAQDLDRERTQRMEVTHRLHQAESVKALVEKDLGVLRQELLQTKASLEEESDSKQDLLMQLRAQEEKTDNQERCLDQMQAKYDSKEKNLQATQSDLESKIATLTADHEKAKARQTALEKTSEAKDDDLKQAQDELRTLKQTVANLKANEEQLMDKYRENCKQIEDKYKHLVEHLKKEVETLYVQAESDKKAAGDRDSKINQLEEELEKEKTEAKKFKTERNAFSLQLVEHKIDMNRLKESEAALIKKVKTLEDDEQKKKKTAVGSAGDAAFKKPDTQAKKTPLPPPLPASEKKAGEKRMLYADYTSDDNDDYLFSPKKAKAYPGAKKSGTTKKRFFVSKNKPEMF